MPGWFTSEPECPIDLETKEWIEQRWAWLTDQFGAQRVRAAEVILPTPEFFPDEFEGKPDDARPILDRVCAYMGIAPETVELTCYEDRNPVQEGEWRHGTAGLYLEEAGKYQVWIEQGNLGDPLALIATMAHELAHVHLLGHRRITADAEDHEPLTDLLTVFLGFGVFTANSVIRERAWLAGGEAGWSMGRLGYLSMPMFGYALARFAEARGEEQPKWAQHLRADVSEAFTKTRRFFAAGAQAEPTPLTAMSRLPVQQSLAVEINEPDESIAHDDSHPDAEDLLERYARGDRDFRGLDLHGVSLCAADLRDSNLSEADLSQVDFSDADLTDAVLTLSNLNEANLIQAVLCGANLRDANLSEAELAGANLAGADLTGADLRAADLAGACLDGTILVRTRRDDATDFSSVDLSSVVCDVDLERELLQRSELANRVNQSAGALVAIVVVAIFTGMIGALIGTGIGAVLSAALSIEVLKAIGASAGAILFAGFCVKKLIKLTR